MRLFPVACVVFTLLFYITASASIGYGEHPPAAVVDAATIRRGAATH